VISIKRTPVAQRERDLILEAMNHQGFTILLNCIRAEANALLAESANAAAIGIISVDKPTFSENNKALVTLSKASELELFLKCVDDCGKPDYPFYHVNLTN
jgi:hypothetical protein